MSLLHSKTYQRGSRGCSGPRVVSSSAASNSKTIGISVSYECDLFHGTMRFEEVSNLSFGSDVRQVTNIKVLHRSSPFSRSSKACCVGLAFTVRASQSRSAAQPHMRAIRTGVFSPAPRNAARPTRNTVFSADKTVHTGACHSRDTMGRVHVRVCLQSRYRVFTGGRTHDHPIPQTGKRAQIATRQASSRCPTWTFVSRDQQNAERT